MDGRLRVDVDLVAVATHLSIEHKRQVTLEEARQWLLDAGFQPDHAGRWLVDARDLGQLDPSEVRSVTRAAGGDGGSRLLDQLTLRPDHRAHRAAPARPPVREDRRWLPRRRGA